MTVDNSKTNHADLKETLRRCSPETVAAAIRFREERDPGAVPEVVYGIIERYQPATAAVQLSKAENSARLIDDLGLDSLTLLEIVMTIEDVLKIRIENEQLREIRTLAQLNDFLHEKISGGGGEEKPAAPRGKHYTREDIALLLPQQPPFLFVDDATVNGDSIEASYTIKGTEFFLEGHFKDNPIFPASVVFEAMGQVACLWLLEEAPARLEKEIESNHVYFASLDGAHFYRKTKPGEKLVFEQKLVKLREPLAIFEGKVSSAGERVATIERLVLAFGEQLLPEEHCADAGVEIGARLMTSPTPNGAVPAVAGV